MSVAKAAPAVVGEITEPLTWAEICARYPDEWVCLVEMDRASPRDPVIRAARVIGHGKTRRDPVVQALPWRGHFDLMGHYYTGRVTERPLRPSLILDDEIRNLIRHRR